ncbi:MAG: hypothetical protein JSS02_35020, partial [Planctomycetes bacterium]|nr:hypothetical protein [Planctomycetota bacterium]
MSQTPLAPAPSQACRSQTLRSQVLHLFVLSGFAIAQPIYDRLGERSAYLVDLQVEAQTIVWLAVLFSLVIPGVLALILAATSRVAPRARDSVMAVMCLVLLTLGAAPLVKRVTPFLPALFQLAVIIVAGVAATWAYFRFARVRMVVSVATPAVLIFPALFLLTTPVARHFFFGHREMHTAHWNPVPVVFVVLDEFCSMSVVNEQ